MYVSLTEGSKHKRKFDDFGEGSSQGHHEKRRPEDVEATLLKLINVVEGKRDLKCTHRGFSNSTREQLTRRGWFKR